MLRLPPAADALPRAPAGEPRYLCRVCHDRETRRLVRDGAALPAVIAPGEMARVTAPLGRCDVCDLEPLAWAGEGVRLCEACYQREARRRVRDGEEVAEG